jgi:hypothetical protein
MVVPPERESGYISFVVGGIAGEMQRAPHLGRKPMARLPHAFERGGRLWWRGRRVRVRTSTGEFLTGTVGGGYLGDALLIAYDPPGSENGNRVEALPPDDVEPIQ